jgi:GT2 family glycosyltransferase
MSSTFITIPTVSGWVHSKVVESVVSQANGHQVSFVVGVKPVALARRKQVEQFLKSNCTHIWFVDDDTIPPPDALKKLLDLEADIATAVTPLFLNNQIVSNLFPTSDATERLAMDQVRATKAGSTMNVAGVGLSCMLVHRRVFEGDAAVKPPFFAELFYEDGRYMSEDIFFCNKVTDDGFVIVADPSIICKHVKEVLI